MKLIKPFLLSLLLAGGLLAQSNQSTTQQVVITAAPPSGVTNVFVNNVGTTGNTYYCYWVVAVFPIGMSQPSGPACTTTANSTLTGSNYNTITWTPTAGATATGYWVIRNTSNLFPATGTTAVNSSAISASTFTQNDESNTLNAFTYLPVPWANASLSVDNNNHSVPFLDISVNGILVGTLSSIGNQSPGGTTQITTSTPYTTFTTISPPNPISTNPTTYASGTEYAGMLYIPSNATLTGACLLNGGTTGTNTNIYILWNSAGTVVAHTATAGTTTGTASKYSCVAFTATVNVMGPQTYFIGVQANGTTDNFQSYAAGSVPTGYFTTSTTGVFGTLTNLVVPSTFTANVGPLMMVY